MNLSEVKTVEELAAILQSLMSGLRNINGLNVGAVGTAPVADDLHVADEIYVGTDVRIHGDDATVSLRIEGVAHNWYNNHFDGGEYPISGWSWQTYSPFSTPSPVPSETASSLRGTAAMATKAFYAKTSIPGQAFFMPFQGSPYHGMAVGLRWDDGSDNNYTQILWRHNTTGGYLGVSNFIVLQKRAGGGSVVETIGAEIPLGIQPSIMCVIEGTLWSNWTLMPMVYYGSSNWNRLPKPYTNAFTPTRFGMYWDAAGYSAAWMYYGFDAIRHQL